MSKFRFTAAQMFEISRSRPVIPGESDIWDILAEGANALLETAEKSESLEACREENESLRAQLKTKDEVRDILEDKIIELRTQLAEATALINDHSGELSGLEMDHCAGYAPDCANYLKKYKND